MCHYFMVQWTTIRVVRPVTEHLMSQRSEVYEFRENVFLNFMPKEEL
jgi:hypothetical protein